MEVDARAEEADEAAADQPVDRLILAVHGIGQKLSGANIVDDAATLRALVSAMWCNQHQKPVFKRLRGSMHEQLTDAWASTPLQHETTAPFGCCACACSWQRMGLFAACV
jgi:hypothetical protein